MDRALYSPLHYPGDYGFIPGTLAEDGDPMDVLALVQEPSFTGCVFEVRPVGILLMEDNDERDQKILAVPTRNPRYDQIHTMDQIFPHVRREIEHFFTIYKELEGRVTRMQGWGGPADARKTIVESRKAYLEKKPRKTRTANNPRSASGPAGGSDSYAASLFSALWGFNVRTDRRAQGSGAVDPVGDEAAGARHARGSI